MHSEAYAWLQRVVSERVLPAMPGPVRVLELGAKNVNGSARPLFRDASYYGLDRVPGPGVDIVQDAATYDGAGLFDVVVTTETLEHAPDPWAVIASAGRALRHGGMLLITAAADPRQPHRCDGREGDLAGEYYANIDPPTLRRHLLDSGWTPVAVHYDIQHGDVYVLAVKS